MSPLSLYEKLPLGYREKKKLDVQSVRPWLRYDFDRLWGTTLSGERFAYYVERGEPTVMRFEHLENEFFANDLQKVNVNRTDSIVRFCSKYGFPVSSGYDGAQRLAWYRRRFRPSIAGFRPLRSILEFASPAGAAAGISLYEAAEENVDESLLGKGPYLLSEEARRIHLNDRSVVGAISEAEIVQTIRALQVSTSLLSAIGYALDHPDEWGATTVADYLCERTHMAQNGPTFFLIPDSGELLKHSRLKSYDTLISDDAEFRSRANAATAAGMDARGIYTSSLGQALVFASNRCMDFLISSLSSYSAELDEERLDASRQGIHDIGSWKSAELKFRRMLSKDNLDDGTFGCLPEAIISQFGLLYDDPAEWRICDNCGRIFKKYREEKPGKVIQKTRFCKRSCANAYSKKKSQGLITE